MNIEKCRVLHDLDYEEINLAAAGPHPPVFACVMRRAGMPKQLECHGFICSSAEDAIIIAANLYQALVDTMKKNKNAGKVDPHSPRSMRRNEFERKSTRKSRRGEPPIRPPRKKRTRGDEPRVVTGLVRRRSIRGSARSVKSNRSNKSNKSGRRRNDPISGASRRGQMSRDDLGRKSSRRPTAAFQQSEVKGDILTKVTIGRTKSFAKTNNQYNLQELFRELKEKEGVESIDDVLKRVISPNGMSFNDIKPVYRELLLKLAMTMSQDEIFERSKSIMASNKKVFKKSSEQHQSGSLGSFFKSFSRQASKANSVAGSSSKHSSTLDTSIKSTTSGGTSGLGSSTNTKSGKSARSSKGLTKADISGPMPILPADLQQTSLSKSMEMLKQSAADQTDDAYVSCSECAYESVCAYGSCACRDKKLRRISLGELKEVAQECDADSCISSEKCYCSMRGDPRDKAASSAKHVDTNASVYSEITADSGTVTDTSCYSYSMSGTIRSNHHHSSASHLSLSPVKLGTLRSVKDNGSTCCSCSEYSVHDMSSIRSSRGLPPIPSDSGTIRSGPYKGDSQWRSRTTSPRRNVSDGRGSEGSSCGSARSSVSPTNLSVRSSTSPTGSNGSQQKVLLLSAVDQRGNIVYRGSSHHSAKITRPDEQHILSMKKTAEIAAMFTPGSSSGSGSKSDMLDPLLNSPTTTTTSGIESDSCSCSQQSTTSSSIRHNPHHNSSAAKHRAAVVGGRSNNHPGLQLGYFP